MISFSVPAKTDVEGHFGAHDLPWVAEAQPLVRQLDLPTVANGLIEDAKLIADPITDRRDVEGRERIHVTGGEPAQSAITESRLLLLFQQVGQILAVSRDGFHHGRPNSEIDDAVAEMWSGQEFGRQIGNALERLV